MVTPSEVRRVWILTFEYAGVKKLGGLGEAVKNLSEGLSSLGYEVTVVMPSHDVELGTELEGVICSGVRVGVDGQFHHYNIRYRILDAKHNLRVVLVRGGDPRTSAILEDPYVYGRAEEKACLLSRALPCLAEVLGLPDLIHSNDWHSALAAISFKINAELKGFAIPHLHQIHLPGSPSFPWHYASPEWCGVPTELHRVWRVTHHQLESAYDLWCSAKGSLEAFSVIEADGIALVSRSMIKDLLSRYGEWLRGKVCVIYNSTSWSLSEVVNDALTMYGTGDRAGLRWTLVREVLNRYRHVGWLEEGDALVLTAGRLTPQKGFEHLLKCFRNLPEGLKLVLLGMSVGDFSYEDLLSRLIEGLDGNAVLITEKVEPRTYKLMHYVANAFVVPSVYEPFGIVTLEAMAVGTPPVVRDVGGLSEIVEDVRYQEDGCGLKVEPNDEMGLGEAVQNIAYVTLFSETGRGFEHVTYQQLRDVLEREPSAGNRMRGNCVKRVDEAFRATNTARQAAECYEMSRRMAYYRAITQ